MVTVQVNKNTINLALFFNWYTLQKELKLTSGYNTNERHIYNSTKKRRGNGVSYTEALTGFIKRIQ